MTVETCTIYPTNRHNRPPPPSKIALHGLDHVNGATQMVNHMFFQRPATIIPNLIDKLKSSLAEALELYPPAAGTVKVTEKGETYIAMDAENILGTPFLVDIKDTPYAGDSEDLSPRPSLLLPPLSSTVAVKISQFSCGTIAVASSMHHQVADLRGFLDFLELWAQLTRGEVIDYTRIPDDWTRTPGRFFSGLNRTSTDPPSPFTVLPAPATGPPPFLLAPSTITRWKFTKSSMERLKRDLSPTASSSDLWISSGDALAALLTGVITRARNDSNVARLEGRSSVESQTEVVAMAADGRGRAPGGNMSGGRYFGNFNTFWCAAVSRSDLLSPTCEASSRIALAFRKALQLRLSAQAIADKIFFFEAPENTQPPGRISWGVVDVILTNWCCFDLQGPKLNFGWGKPFNATTGSGTIFPPGFCIMSQHKESGDVSVMMTVEHEGADRLKADTLLNKYATQNPDHSKC